jgi:hypothetical protein
MSTLGIGSLSAAAGVAALTKSVVDFAGSARHLQFMSQQTALTVNQLRNWEQEASRLETSAESLTSGFTEFNAQMERMRRGGSFIGVQREVQQLRAALGTWNTGGLEQLVKSLQGLGREAQLEKILKFADHVRDIGQRRNLLKAFGLDPALANKASTEILADLDQIHKALGDLTPAQLKGGIEFQESIEKLKTSLTGLRDSVGADLAPTMAVVAESIAKFGQLHAGDIADGLKGFVGEMRELGNSDFVAGMRAFASGLDEVVKATTGWAPVIGAIALYKFAQFTGVIAGLRGVAGAMRMLAGVPPPAWLMPLLAALAAAKGAQEFAKDPGGAVGLTGPNSMLNHLKELYGMLPGGGAKPDIQDERIMPPPGTGPGGTPPVPLWKRLFHLGENESGIQPAGFNVVGGGANPLLGGAGDPRGAERIIEAGVLQALRDFASETKGAEGAGGGAGAGGGMSAIRAAYSPGGGGYGGAGGGTGEPAAGGGAGTGGGAASEPMGSLAGKPQGVESITRKFHPPSIPAGMGGMVADRLKSAGVNLPAALEHKIRSGGQVTEGDLKALPPATLEKANKAITGAGRPPLYGDAKPQRFSIGDIRKSVQGGGLPDVGSYGGVARRGYGGATQLPSGPSAANSYIGAQRAGFAKELQDPQFRSQFAAMLQAEGPTLGTAESAMNRAAATGRSLHEMVTGSIGRRFYSTYGRFIGGSASALRKYNPLIEKATAGSDTIRGFTDQGMPTDPNGPLHRGRGGPYLGPYVGQHGNIFNDWQRGRYRNWREDFEAHAQAAAAPATDEATKTTALHGDALRHHFGVGQRGRKPGFTGDLLGAGQRAGLMGQTQHTVKGRAAVDISLNGFPRGTVSKSRTDGELFKEVRLNRGRAMPPANQEG